MALLVLSAAMFLRGSDEIDEDAILHHRSYARYRLTDHSAIIGRRIKCPGRAFNCNGRSPYYGNPITTHDEAIFLFGDQILPPDNFGAERMEDFEVELQRDEEFRLANWIREFRHSRESVEEERLRYERDENSLRN